MSVDCWLGRQQTTDSLGFCCLLAGWWLGGLNGGGTGSKSINCNHYATECTTSFKISISRGVFEGDINSDCILLQHLQQQLLQQLLQHRCSICCSICCMLHRAIANFGNSIPDFTPPQQKKSTLRFQAQLQPTNQPWYKCTHQNSQP